MGDDLEPRSYRVTVTLNRLNVEGLSARLFMGWGEGGWTGKVHKTDTELTEDVWGKC